MDYAAHIARICKIEDIEVRFGNHRRAKANHRSRYIKIRPVKTAITYAVALHEIGHILHPQGHNGTRLDKETAAWVWAKANAKQWTDRMEQRMQKSLRGYFDWSLRHKTMKRASTDHPIHILMNAPPVAHR